MTNNQIFMLHFAGGDRYSYRFLYPYVKSDRIFPIELSGRGLRCKEPFEFDELEVIEDVFRQIQQVQRDKNIILYGHSLGAILAFHVIEKLVNRNFNVKLIVTGNAGPLIKSHKSLFDLPSSELKKELIAMGGTPEILLDNYDLFAFYEPIFRYDFLLAEKLTRLKAPKLRCPIICIMGSEETSVNDIDNWSKFTDEQFDSLVVDGGHFFIYDHPHAVANAINLCLNLIC